MILSFFLAAFLLAARADDFNAELLDAAAVGDITRVGGALDKGANVEARNEAGATPLMWAALKGHIDVVTLLIKRGANVNAKTSSGATALKGAATHGHLDVVRLLLEKGADANAKDNQGQNALDAARDSGQTGAVEILQGAMRKDASASKDFGEVKQGPPGANADLGGVRHSNGQITERVVDIPTRAGVTQRFLLLTPQNPKATVILFAGGPGGLRILPDGSFTWGKGNFLVRSRNLFAENGLSAAVVDAPSDRQTAPYMTGFRQTAKHVADVKAVIAWLRQHASIPVWLVGTSRGTQSAAFIATQLSGQEGPDGLVLTSTVLVDPKGRPVTDMDLGRLKIPVLVMQHGQDVCPSYPFDQVPRLMKKLTAAPRKELITFTGGDNRGDPCEAWSYHGFNGLEQQVVQKMVEWIVAN